MVLQITKTKSTTLISVTEPTLLVGKVGKEFEESLLESIDESSGQYLIDFENVEFIEKEVIGSLLVLQKVLRENGGSLKLTGIHRALRVIVEVLRLREYFEIIDELMPPMPCMATAAAV